MTAHELARLLLDGSDLLVTIEGYEGGVNRLTNVDQPTPIHLGIHTTEWYMGNHEYCQGTFCAYNDDGCVELPQAIHLS